jgi:hypothetical protein
VLRFLWCEQAKDFPRLLSFQLAQQQVKSSCGRAFSISAASSFASRCSNRCWAVGIMY